MVSIGDRVKGVGPSMASGASGFCVYALADFS